MYLHEIKEKKISKDIRILGIDPGSNVTGWGVIEEKSGVLSLVDCGAIKPKKGDFSSRLSFIYCDIMAICKEYRPEEAAIEQVFLAKNPLSAIKLGQARGVALAACFQSGMIPFDYEATKIKQSIVGMGRAEKTQVSFMVHMLLNIKENLSQLDTTDALAVALCHANTRKFQSLL